MSEVQNTFFPSVEKRRILMVEDEIINQEILKANLIDSYDIITATTGTEALDILSIQYETISLILLDLNLPDIHGFDVLRKIKSDPVLNRLPVIVVTADSEAEVESLSLGAIDFIPKPYPQQKVILARILRTIELSEDRDILRWTERDHLTGLYNKEFFYRYAAQLDMYHKDASTDAILLNINHFHTINDRHGKSYGDKVLRCVAECVQETVRDTGGIVCRSEADTFLIYCPHRDDYDAILYPANWPDKRILAWDTLLRARAIENQCFVIGVNRSGSDEFGFYPGHSTIIGPYGDVVVETDESPQMVSAELDMDRLIRFRDKFPVLQDADL